MRHVNRSNQCDDGSMRCAISGRLWARLYDLIMRRVEHGGLAALRREIVSQAYGRTLEIGAGTGANVPFYPATASPLILTEPDPHKLRRLRRRADRSRPDAQTVSARAHCLPFPDAAFDTVVATLVLCSVPSQADALAELRRVLRPDGRLLFIEHVRSDNQRRARRQDRWRPVWRALTGGCEPNRDTTAAITAAGFNLADLRHDRMPASPSIVRPLAIGAAMRSKAGGTERTSTYRDVPP
jgi:SAM-dependent methyltransferase